MQRPRALLFDVFGTLVDWRSGLIEAGRRVRPDLAQDWGRIVDDWRRAYQPAMDEVVRSARPWRDLDDIQAQTLDTVLETLAVALAGEHRKELVQSWRRLPPWPDVPDGLATLRTLCITATLSNGHVALLVDLLRYAGLQVDATLSAQLAHSYKPQPVVYLHAIELLEVAPEEAMLVASHARDLRAAAALGLRATFVRRPAEWGPGGGDEPPAEVPGLLVVDSLPELAQALA